MTRSIVFSSILAMAFAALAPAVKADFYIYEGYSNTEVDGGGGTTPSYKDIYLLNNIPDCDDFANSIGLVIDPNNDASGGNCACDGCDVGVAPADQDITRFEIYNGSGDDACISDPGEHITLYRRDDGSFGIESTTSGTIGSCVRDSSDSIGPCAQTALTGANADMIFHCTTAAAIINGISGN